MITITRRQAKSIRSVFRRALNLTRGQGPVLVFTTAIEEDVVHDARTFALVFCGIIQLVYMIPAIVCLLIRGKTKSAKDC